MCNYDDYRVLEIAAGLLADKRLILRPERIGTFLEKTAEKISKLPLPHASGDVKKIADVYTAKLDEMTKQGLRSSEGWWENNFCHRFTSGCTFLDCAGQVDEILPVLENIKGLDDRWTFEPASNIDIKPGFIPGHNWIRAIPKSPENPLLWFDPLHGKWGTGECADCYPLSAPIWREW